MLSYLIGFFLVSIIVSSLCSLWESVLLSITPSYVQIVLSEKRSYGQMLDRFKTTIEQPLAAILTLNTIAHTVGAIGVGQQASLIWANASSVITGFIVPAIMTLAILIISEIIPKTIGAMSWKSLTPFTIYSLKIVIILLWPMVVACQFITGLVSKSYHKQSFSRQDLLALTKLGSKEGKVNSTEYVFIQNTLKLRQLRVKEIMTPSTVILSAPETMTVQTFFDKHPSIPFSRIPIYASHTLDNITGFILKTDLLAARYTETANAPLSNLKRSIQIVPETTTVFQLFNDLIRNRHHMAMVVDEHGAIVGLVSMEDVLETLIGQEIVDETDQIIDMQAYAKAKMTTNYD